jgi:L-ribulokinase
MVPPEDELFAAIEGTALHTRIILDRMAEKGSPVHRVINGGGIPRRNNALNRVYANALNRPVLVPSGDVTSRGSAIFAFLASGDFKSIEEAQTALCPASVTFVPDAAEAAVYDRLYRDLYFPLGQPNSAAVRIGHILPKLREIAAESQTLSREAQ